MTSVKLAGVSKRYGDVEVICDIDLEIAAGEFAVFVGPSGCGKSTLLRMIAGLENITDGVLSIDGETMNAMPAAGRGIAMVFQSYALYPHMSVYKNMAFALETARLPKLEIKARVERAAQILQIEPLLKRKPKQLSGGQRQRVAIGRAIVREPRVFLFDEPLSNLDAELRVQMRVEIAKLHRNLGTTMIYVTHDQVEAMTMADKIVVLRAGRIEQVGSPLELYNRPGNAFVATFIGNPKMNMLAMTIEESKTSLVLHGAAGTLLLPARGPVTYQGPVSFGIRPEHLNADDVGTRLGPATVQVVEQLGGGTLVHAQLADGQPLVLALSGQKQIAPGTVIEASFDPALAHLFKSDGARLQ